MKVGDTVHLHSIDPMRESCHGLVLATDEDGGATVKWNHMGSPLSHFRHHLVVVKPYIVEDTRSYLEAVATEK